MKVLVIGATGYAGHRIATALRRRGHDVTGLTRDLAGAGARALAAAEIRPVAGELADPAGYREHLWDADVVVHTAMDYADPAGSDRALIAELVAAPRHLVYTTGISLHGRVDTPELDEESPSSPDNPLHFRYQLERELIASGLPHTIVRPAFLYGHDSRTSQLGRWFAAPRFVGDKDKRWSFVHVDDLAEAYVRIVERADAPLGDIFVIGEENPPPALEVFTAAFRAAGHAGEVTVHPISPEEWLEQAADQDERVNSAKARRELGWTPRHAGPIAGMATYYAAWQAANA
ncbi:NAD-dependent epimerase/dehydratase family protein [Actinoplanes sp. NPDC051494]|uniref:NAD-dependent epimerase/dehydratase family protein n=1 Tax=Actinoplanes sp. NPDC051494 TaxID=3363907 RepID=UPI00378E26A0